MKMKIKLSELLTNITIGHNDYICHTAEYLADKQKPNAGKRWWCDEEHTHAEIKRIMPEYIRADTSGTLENWTRNLPSHLRTSRFNDKTVEFRVKFLKWAIKKFGDQELVFKFS